MYYSDEIVEEVRSRNDIVEVVSGYVRLQKKGGRHWGLCPFHNEKSASFSVNGDLQVYHCFGCGAGGNVYTFVMNYENYTFPEAVRMLAERAGVALPQEDGSEEARRRGDRRARLLEVNKAAARFFYYQLRSPHGQIGYQYLKKRELTDETMRSFGLGFAGKNGANLVQYLREKGFEDQLIQEAGLATHSEKYGLNSQFWNRVMYPIQDINNRVIGFGGRVMGDGEPKYLNSPETPIFDKRRNLYGLNYARKARSGNIILCEGYMDVIAMHQAGFTQAVASLGTAFTAEQAALLKRYTETVLLAYDSDGKIAGHGDTNEDFEMGSFSAFIEESADLYRQDFRYPELLETAIREGKIDPATAGLKYCDIVDFATGALLYDDTREYFIPTVGDALHTVEFEVGALYPVPELAAMLMDRINELFDYPPVNNA